MLASLSAVTGFAAAAAPQGIAWIMADDLGWGEPGAFPSTSPHGRIATPHLDQFASEGVRFTNAYAGYTVCAPSRTTLMTGFHSGHFPREGLNGEELAPAQSASLLTLPAMLQKAGYMTAAAGKVAPLTAPVEQGFDSFIGQVDQGLCHNMYPRFIDEGNATLNVNLTHNWAIAADAKAARAQCMASPSSFNYTVDITHHASLAFVRARAADGKKFFLYESFTVPHAGGWGHAPSMPESGAPVPSDGRYASESWPEVERDHAAVITYLDNCVGELIAELKTGGLDDKTLLFFASDNGAHLEGGHDYHFFNSTGGLLGHKRSLYEGGYRSPTMVRWPAAVAPAVSDVPFAFWDVIPTLIELIGADEPAAAALDGISIAPTLLGKPQPARAAPLYWTWPGTGVPPLPAGWTAHQTRDGRIAHQSPDGRVVEHRAPKGASGYAVRIGEWKGVVPHCANTTSLRPSAGDAMQVYHLPTDPFETTDIADTAAGKAPLALLRGTLAEDPTLSCHCFQC